MSIESGSFETAADVKAYVNKYGGEKNVLGFIFDNSMQLSFVGTERVNKNNPVDSAFTFARFVDESINAFTIRQLDSRQNPYMTLHPISNLQAIVMRYSENGNNVAINNYDGPLIFRGV